ncbi:MAG: hypothetical protein B6U65_01380 [Candidatus Wolframiiraptor sp. EX4484-121]|nr:MAG: hypothetical protein B6U65_01380 [Candidatus Wolframiiraptor sp. EX4484-121]
MKNSLGSYIEGKIYELKVAGELLGRGFDVYMPFVDSGVDMVAIHRVSKKILFIQVKKAKYNAKRRRWDFRNIPLKEVEDVSQGHGAFFVFVLERPNKTDLFLVLPSKFIKMHKDNLYPVNNPGRGRSVAIIVEEGFGETAAFIKLKGKEERIPVRLNNWDILLG